jgi:hypothetical protein
MMLRGIATTLLIVAAFVGGGLAAAHLAALILQVFR